MTKHWFIRFILGLPARVEDAVALRNALPELESKDFQLKTRASLFWNLLLSCNTNEEVLRELHRWISNIEEPNDSELSKYHNCLSSTCPYQSSQTESNRDNGFSIVHFMMAAGGPNAKPPRDSFLNLVKRTHPENDPPQEVILTDPYIYSDISEDGQEGGFSNLVAYLEVLGISDDDTFTLLMTPSPKRGTVTARKNLHRYLKKKFKNIKLKNYSPQLKCNGQIF